jgi:hypothetical protein
MSGSGGGATTGGGRATLASDTELNGLGATNSDCAIWSTSSFEKEISGRAGGAAALALHFLSWR